MSDVDPDEWAARTLVAANARIDQWAAQIRELFRNTYGLPPERAPWDETNENEEQP